MFADGAGNHAKVVERKADAVVVSEGSPDCESLLVQVAGTVVVPPVRRHQAQPVERVGDPVPAPDLAPECQARLI